MPVYNKQNTYADAMKIVLRFEGGKDDDPRDPGGRTNQGIIQREFSAWLKKNGRPNRDVFTMNNEERDAIYWENYGIKIRFNELPPGIDFLVLDGAINSGVAQSVKWIQRELNLTADGVLGAVTLQRIIDHPDHDLLVAGVCNRRMAFLRALKTWSYFGKGWTSRVSQLKKTCQAWAMGSVGSAVVWEPNMNKKGLSIDAKPLVSTAPADATTSGGIVSATLSTAQATLMPAQGLHPAIDRIITILVIVGVVAAAVGAVWAWYARQHNAALQDALNIGTTVVPGAADNDVVPESVLIEYADPNARGVASGNAATTGDPLP
jgi:lysozyme family protein